MAWLPSLLENKRWSETMEEAMGCPSTQEFSHLQKRRGM